MTQYTSGPLIPEGTTVGQSSTDKISFWGVTPVVQQSGAALASIGVTSATAGGFGTTTSAQFMALVTRVDAIISVLKTTGIIASV